MMVSLLIFYVVVGIGVGFILYYIYPDHYFDWYPFIPGYYTVLGVILYSSLMVYKKKNPKKMINAYMMMRGIKFILTTATILIYNLTMDEYIYEFSITTVGFYFFYLFIETYIYIKFEKEKAVK